MNYLFFDTETTGLPDFRAPSDADHQPHVVQLAAILADAAGQERAVLNVLVKPDGWTIPDETAAIHGITTETAEAFGVPEALVVRMFLRLSNLSDVHVAHNLPFDMRIMRIAMLRAGMTREALDVISAKTGACTMRMSSPIINLPPTQKMTDAGFAKPKPPKLAECVQHFFGEPLVGAHDALVDIRACKRVFLHLQALKAAA